jgi:hypothetical protein
MASRAPGGMEREHHHGEAARVLTRYDGGLGRRSGSRSLGCGLELP